MTESTEAIRLVVETDVDKQLVTDIFRAARFDLARIEIYVARGKMAAAPLVEALAQSHAHCAVLVDLDEASVPDATAHARQQLGLTDSAVRIFCAVPEAEAWLFADDDFLRARDDLDLESRGILRRLPLPEEIPDPKGLARTLLGPPKYWDFVRDIDITRACARSPSLRAFIEGISEWLSVDPPEMIERVGRTFERDVLASLISEVSPSDAIIWRTLDGTTYTAQQVKDAVEEGSEIGRQYASDLLRISRDLLRRQANRGLRDR